VRACQRADVPGGHEDLRRGDVAWATVTAHGWLLTNQREGDVARAERPNWRRGYQATTSNPTCAAATHRHQASVGRQAGD
jgi:hypothetical protein